MMKEALLCHAQLLFQPWGTHHEGRAIVRSLRWSLASKEMAHNQHGIHFLLTCPGHTCYFFGTLSATIPLQSWSEMAWREKGIWGEVMQSLQMTQLFPRFWFFFFTKCNKCPPHEPPQIPLVVWLFLIIQTSAYRNVSLVLLGDSCLHPSPSTWSCVLEWRLSVLYYLPSQILNFISPFWMKPYGRQRHLKILFSPPYNLFEWLQTAVAL